VKDDPRGETVPDPPVESMDELRQRSTNADANGVRGTEAVPEKEAKKKKQKKSAPAPVANEVDISKLDIRVGVISKAWEHPVADKLFCEEIDIGEESGPRQIASGLKQHYNLEDLEGRKVLVLANLKARKIGWIPFTWNGSLCC
jgi:aminoacyl tRNA synthase complex-interacting multifunctional protein 1